MEILSYLPSVAEGANVRIHTDPLPLPVLDEDADNHEDDGPQNEGEDDDNMMDFNEYDLQRARRSADYGTCLAELYFRNGCARFCMSARWNYLDVVRVCKHWKETVYACPQFWANITPHDRGSVSRSLTLSRNLPLDIIVDASSGTKRSLMAFDLILRALHRIRDLEIRTYSTDSLSRATWAKTLVDRLAESPAPRLGSLRINSRYTSAMQYPMLTTDWVEQEFPSLRVLQLSAIEMYSPCALLAPTLTELQLADCIPPWETASAFFETFSRLPQLEILVLARCPNPSDFDKERPPVPSSTSLPILLRYLTSIELDGSFRFINRVLSAFAFPLGATSLKLSYTYDERGVDLGHDSPAELTRVYDKFASYAREMQPGMHFSHASCDFDLDDNWIEITLERDDPTKVIVSLRHTWDEHLHRHVGDILAFVRRTSGALFSRTDDTAVELDITGDFEPITAASPTFTLEACLELLAGLNGLSWLRLSSEAAYAFIPWMIHRLHTTANIPPAEQDGDTLDTADTNPDDALWMVHARDDLQRRSAAKRQSKVDPTLPFPSLRTLALSECNLGESIHEDDSRPEDILFSYLWLYLHSQQPRLILDTVELTQRMLEELRRKLGPEHLLERDIVTEEDDPHINVVHSSWSVGVEELEVYVGSRMKIVRTPRWSVLGDEQEHSDSDGGDDDSDY
ncbi:unnamed protein product [Peniophora sp. CBMAI 1063]|nr:unnamed protein product [Peniophora sp. CBMAI 1063]